MKVCVKKCGVTCYDMERVVVKNIQRNGIMTQRSHNDCIVFTLNNI